MPDLDTLLRAADAGAATAIDQIVALLYGELHRLVHSRLRHPGDARHRGGRGPARQADHRGGDAIRVALYTAIGDGMPATDDKVIQVHEALEALAGTDPRLARVVEMRYSGGLVKAEIADYLGITERTVQRDWHKARLLLSGMPR